MASATKEYKIVINGIKESISQVDTLNKQLDALEKRMNDLQGKGINVGSVKVDSSSLKEQDNIQKQILSTEQKISDVRDKEYQNVIKLKDELKQAKTEAEGLAASSKLLDNNYSNNTMAGLKEQLKDIKRVLNTTEIDSPMFKQLTEEANTITQKLKDMEAAYGTFGRNVGNYASAAEGFKGLQIQVGNVTREFNNATEALKQLKRERDTLGVSDKASKEFKDLDLVVKQLESTIKDLSKSSSFMDNMLDTMQSIVAIASTAKGIGAVFGMDNDKIEETIKKLVALQNVLQGLETIQKQMQTNEGIGKWLSTGNNAINKFSTGLFGAKKAVEGVAAAEKSATLASKLFGAALKGIGIGLIISLIASLVKHWDKINATINKSIPALEKFGGIIGWLEGLFNGLINVMSSTIEVLYKLIQGDFSGAWGAITEAWNSGFQEVVDDRIREEKAAAAESLKIEMDLLEAKYGEEVKYTQRYRQLLAERNKLLKESYDPNTKEGKKALRELEVEQEREKKAYRDHAKEMAKLQKEADQELTDLKIANMKEGLNKTLTQLEEERKRRIEKARETGRNVREIEAEINKQFDQKELDARNDFANKTVEIYRNMFDAILKLEADGNTRRLEMMQTQADVNAWNDEDYFRRSKIPSSARTYGASVGYVSAEDIKNAQKFNELYDNLIRRNEYIKTLEEGTQEWKDMAESIFEAKKKLDDFITTTKGYSQDGDKIYTPFANIVYSADAYKRDIEEVFNARRNALKKGYESLIKEQNENEKAMYEQRLTINKDAERQEIAQLDDNRKDINDRILEWYDVEKENLWMQYKDGIKTYEQYYADLMMLESDFSSQMQKAEDEYYTQLEDIQKQHRDEEDNLDMEHWENLRKNSQQYYDSALQEARDYQTAINNVMSINPLYDSWGVFRWDENKRNIDEAKENIRNLVSSIAEDRKKLNEDFGKGLIDPEYYESTNREFSRMTQQCIDNMASLEEESKQRFPKLMESLQEYIQAFSQTLTSILEAVWAAQDAAYEREKEQLEKEAEEYEEMLQKQKEATEKYKDAVDSIEDELSTARGDRRQELIDQLNAEKAAQRESLKEEKRIEKEQEKIEEKKEKLELEQKKRQKARDITTALINASLAVSYAAVNHWPLPAIPMMAAAAIQGAAQVAAIKAQKYATGGVIEGKSHSQGGVKVLGGRAEVEGGEYIVNKRTTAKNAPLLSYINAKDKKIELEDIVDFYSTGVRRTIHAVSPQRKFAEGGQIPLLRDDLTINDRLLDAFERYSERPVQVAVTEINDVQDDIRRVEVLAGAR